MTDTDRVIVLGSASPRRREILESLGVSHVVFVVEVDEGVLPGERSDDYLVRVVRAKLAAVRAKLPDDLRARAAGIVVADTSVIAEDDLHAETILGKPIDVDDACRMIERLAGRTHEVHTRFAVASVQEGGFLHEETVRTRVTFRPLGAARVLAYARSGEGIDKAGAYAVQGLGAAIVSRIEGSYSNVVGLPACEVAVALEAFGLR